MSGHESHSQEHHDPEHHGNEHHGHGHEHNHGHDHGSHGQETRIVERHADVCIIGGADAALAAALRLGRRDLSVIVIEAGGHAGAADSPAGAAREAVRSHGGEIIPGTVTSVARTEGGAAGFRVGLTSGNTIVAARVLRGAQFPDVAGLAAELAGTDIDALAAELDPAEPGNPGAVRPSANQADWDQRYSGERMWSGNPNGTIVNEAGHLKPGCALDVGAGEGGDAIWLAANGWAVTANDVSQRALDRVSAAAAARGLRVETLHASANARDAFPAGEFDLVAVSYASIPRTPDDRAVRNILNAVAPGGTLLILSHDIEPLRAPDGSSGHGDRSFDADAYVRVEDFAAALAGSADWDVELHEKRPRPAGHSAASHHVDDVVLRARRH